VFAVGAVAEIALDHDHGLGDFEHLLGLQKPDEVGEPREGLRLAVRGAESAAHGEVEAEDFAFVDPLFFKDGDEAQILREHVHVVVRRHDHAGLELAR
jgi:hypothetical protein